MDETKSIKAEQKQKPCYEAPKLIALNGVASGAGGPDLFCTSGSGADPHCETGSAAGLDCFMGNSVF